MAPTLKKQKINNKGKSIDKTPAKKPKVTVEEESEESSSNEDQSELEEEQESELGEEIGSDDEVDLADVSSSEEEKDEEDEEEDDEESNFPKLKKKKGKTTDDGSESFANALNSIVNSKLKAYDRKDPILARNKTTLKKLESDKLELKAKKALLQEKKTLHDKFRVKNLLPSSDEPEKVREVIQKEKDLKKVAQRGVVRLFNAVLSTQVKTNQEISKEKVGQSKKQELMNDVSKEKFLDLIAAAGNED
ncbi:Ribosomal RNA-processing protein 15 [Candida viswanathii]|uniref:Ribosomal RNA-processing protein 15 n=1 Tax=Candida viswanathii TaxID=5486 RepID=A0A367XLM8_9ASCO|nr:Ribosomal RNA-processing protein 15 [Candida viswanathii]